MTKRSLVLLLVSITVAGTTVYVLRDVNRLVVLGLLIFSTIAIGVAIYIAHNIRHSSKTLSIGDAIALLGPVLSAITIFVTILTTTNSRPVSSISVSTPVAIANTPNAVNQSSTSNSTPTVVAAPSATTTPKPTQVPTREPTITPTPNLNTPEGITTAFFSALQRGEGQIAHSLYSRYSIDFWIGALEMSEEELLQGLSKEYAVASTRNFTFTVGKQEKIDDQTSHVPVSVKFSDESTEFYECCILRLEENGWRINRGTFTTGSLIDYRPLKASDHTQTSHDVTVTLHYVARFTRQIALYLSVDSSRSDCVFWGTLSTPQSPSSIARFEFEDGPPQFSVGTIVFREKEKSRKGGSIRINRFFSSYPHTVELLNWHPALYCQHAPDVSKREDWTYPFELRYAR